MVSPTLDTSLQKQATPEITWSVRLASCFLISPRRRRLMFSISLACAMVGCEGQTGEVSQVQSNLGWLGTKYGMFVSAHRGRTPKNIDEFRKYIEKKTTAAEMERLKVKSVEELFVSSQDGKPFKFITYSKLPPLVGGQPPPVVFHEEIGQDGQRAIAYLGGNTQTVDEATLQSLLPAGSR